MAGNNTLQYQGIADMASFGQFGFRKLVSTDISETGERFVAIQVLEDAEISVDCKGRGDTTFSDTLSAGTAIYGDFENISVTTGKVLAYLRDLD